MTAKRPVFGADMPRQNHEKDLVKGFVAALRKHVQKQIRIAELINANCNSRIFADVEFKSLSKIHWVIEAKSDLSPNKRQAQCCSQDLWRIA
jgi:NADP-dependent 3-hydroxy acid dehydrogenase YdfG